MNKNTVVLLSLLTFANIGQSAELHTANAFTFNPLPTPIDGLALLIGAGIGNTFLKDLNALEEPVLEKSFPAPTEKKGTLIFYNHLITVGTELSVLTLCLAGRIAYAESLPIEATQIFDYALAGIAGRVALPLFSHTLLTPESK